ncbi:MAG: Rieske 2Fe-2S domain-containing protein [Methanocella sp.]
MAFIKVAKASAVPAGAVIGYETGGKNVAIANVGGKFYAFEDKCPHMGARLSTGVLLGNVVMCKMHGEQFNLKTGKPVMMLTHEPLKLYPVKVEGEDILVEI